MKFSKEPMILTSSAPIAPDGSEYNKLYLIAIVTAIAGCVGGAIPGLIVGGVCGLIVGYAIKVLIIQYKQSQLRHDVCFALPAVVPYPVLIGELSKRLTPLGLTVEAKGNGQPVIGHNNVIYDVCYNDSKTFTIWWRKSAVRAFMPHSDIKLYRNCVVSMGIIGYHIQQICKEHTTQNNQT